VSITYDEVWISTKREINICKDYIKSYEREISKIEKKLGLKASGIKKEMLRDKEIRRLFEIAFALEREKKRLKELEELLK
jgi:predicted RNase H-like nuclease (RuvC/YqgF family)